MRYVVLKVFEFLPLEQVRTLIEEEFVYVLQLFDLNSQQQEELFIITKKLYDCEHEITKLQDQFKAEEQTIQNEESMIDSKIANLSNSIRMGNPRLMDMEKNITEAELK